MIPIKIEKLIYSSHSIRERCREVKGFIEFVPRSFFKVGCKYCNEERNGLFRAVYIYDDTRDLHLIIDPNNGEVVTNFTKFNNNRGIYKGRFRITNEPKRRAK